MKIDKIFVIHYKPLVERKKYLDEVLPLLEIPYEYSTRFDRESPEIHDIKFIDLSESNREKRNVYYEQYIARISEGVTRDSWRANLLEHYHIFKDFVANDDLQNILIFEDDVIFNADLKDALNLYCQLLPEDYDTLFIGSGCGLKLPFETSDIIAKHPKFHSKCGDSYIVSKKAAKKIVEHCLPLYCNWDWELNYQQSMHQMNVYWVVNPLVKQGSECGYYNSSC
jgi:hypothetical protein